jgi:hypothetical protein
MLSFELAVELLHFLSQVLILQFDLSRHSVVRCLLLEQLKLLIFIHLRLTVRIINNHLLL